MASHLIRNQIMLEKRQQERLRVLAKKQGKSLSELIRELIESYLEEQERLEEKQLLQTLSELRQIREKNATQYGVYEGDLIREIREERERQMDDT